MSELQKRTAPGVHQSRHLGDGGERSDVGAGETLRRDGEGHGGRMGGGGRRCKSHLERRTDFDGFFQDRLTANVSIDSRVHRFFPTLVVN